MIRKTAEFPTESVFNQILRVFFLMLQYNENSPKHFLKLNKKNESHLTV